MFARKEGGGGCAFGRLAEDVYRRSSNGKEMAMKRDRGERRKRTSGCYGNASSGIPSGREQDLLWAHPERKDNEEGSSTSLTAVYWMCLNCRSRPAILEDFRGRSRATETGGEFSEDKNV